MKATPMGVLLLTLVGSIYGAAFLALISEAPLRADADTRFPTGSSLRRAAGGSALAAEYLRARGHRVDQLLHQNLAMLPAESVVFILQPQIISERSESRPLLTLSEEAFLRRGGRMVVTLEGSVASIRVRPLPASRAWTRVHPLLPGGAIKGPMRSYEIHGPWMEGAHALALAEGLVVAARRAYGRGDLIVIGAPETFSNERLAGGETLPWLEALALGRQVYFDETVHGLFETKGVFDLLGDWGLLPAVWASALFALVLVLRARNPFGPPERRPAADYADSVDLVEALGLLYRRSMSVDEALSRYASTPRTAAVRTSTPPLGRLRPKGALPDQLRDINQSMRRLPNRARSL